VKTNVSPDDPTGTEVGDTLMVPEPSGAAMMTTLAAGEPAVSVSAVTENNELA